MVETDAVVIGAGPVGLYQAFQLGLQDLRAHLIDALPHPGGQCAELYPDKPIYDIPGLPVCSGAELTQRLLQQLHPFQTPLHLGQQVTSLQAQPDGRWLLSTSSGTQFLAPTVFIAAGVGAFLPRKVAVPGLEAFETGKTPQVYYHHIDPSHCAGRHVVVMGGEEAALDTTWQLLQAPAGQACASLTLLHRSERLKAKADLEQSIRQAIESGTLRFVVGQPMGLDSDSHEDSSRLRHLHLVTPETPEGQTQALKVDLLLPRLGLSPKLGPVADWGLAMERKLIEVDTGHFATSQPGIFAVGDINHYPGKRKLIVCGFHEATLAAFAAAAIVHPDRRVLLQYTTTSPQLHALLGVAPPITFD